MAEIFNTDLPPRFQFKPGTEEEQKKEIEEYLERLSSSVDEMLKRVFDRLDSKDLWKIDGSETQLVTADEVDMQTKKIINVTDPAAAQDAATKASSEAAATAAGLWEVDGTEHQLKTADEIDMQTKKIINVVDPTSNQDAATKKFHDDDMDAEMNTSTGHDHDGTDSKKVAYSDLTGAPSAANTSNSLLNHMTEITGGGSGAVEIGWFKFKKIAGISTVTIEARLKNNESSRPATITVGIGGQNNNVARTNTSYAWATAADIDVSGLSDGTTYDGVVSLAGDGTYDGWVAGLSLIGS